MGLVSGVVLGLSGGWCRCGKRRGACLGVVLGGRRRPGRRGSSALGQGAVVGVPAVGVRSGPEGKGVEPGEGGDQLFGPGPALGDPQPQLVIAPHALTPAAALLTRCALGQLRPSTVEPCRTVIPRTRLRRTAGDAGGCPRTRPAPCGSCADGAPRGPFRTGGRTRGRSSWCRCGRGSQPASIGWRPQR